MTPHGNRYMSCALATTGRSPINRPSVLTKSFGPAVSRPNCADAVGDVARLLCEVTGLNLALDASRPSAFDSTSDTTPCQFCDIRLVRANVAPLYRMYIPAGFV